MTSKNLLFRLPIATTTALLNDISCIDRATKHDNPHRPIVHRRSSAFIAPAKAATFAQCSDFAARCIDGAAHDVNDLALDPTSLTYKIWGFLVRSLRHRRTTALWTEIFAWMRLIGEASLANRPHRSFPTDSRHHESS
ncbi:MAG: hypothetical protein ACREP7_23505 [Lysobacter sp.]